MDTLPLPPKPNLNYYKKRAKALVAAARSDQDTAVERWARDWIESLSGGADDRIRARKY